MREDTAVARIRGRLRPYATVLKVILVLVAVDLFVRGPFFDRYIMPGLVYKYALLRERTLGAHPSILFDALDKLPVPGVRIAFVGDSTMQAFESPDVTTVPYMVEKALRGALGRADIESIDTSVSGLYIGDGALVVDKLVGAKVDVIVYGILLRAFARDLNTQWVTRVRSEMGLRDLSRMTAVGGFPWLVRNVGVESLVGGVVHNTWATYAYRTLLGRWLTKIAPPLQAVLQPPPIARQAAIAPRAPNASGFDLTREEFGYPNPSWEALDLLGRLCREYAAWRCLVFSGPINPEHRVTAAEPGFYDEFRERMRIVAGRNGIVWRDYTDAMTAEDFLPSRFGETRRDAIHLNVEGRQKLAQRLAQPLSEIVARVVQERNGRGAPALAIED